MPYFFIKSGEDGTWVEEVSEEKLLEWIQPDEAGEFYFGEPLTFLASIPENDKGYWINVPDNAAVIIYGDILIPKPKRVVTQYELEKTS